MLQKIQIIGIIGILLVSSLPQVLADDITPPTTTCRIDPPEPTGNGWYCPPVYITLIAIDNESGINHTNFRINQLPWQIYTKKIELCWHGNNTIAYYSTDNAGNIEPINSLCIKIDDNAPIIHTTLDPPEPNGNHGWYIPPLKIIVNITDNASGVFYPTPSNFTINITNQTTHVPEIKAIDYVGNQAIYQINLQIDNNKPTIDLTWEAVGGWSRDIIFTAICADATSGIDSVEFYLNEVLQYTDDTTPYEWIWTYLPGIKITIKAVAYDRAGNSDYDFRSGEVFSTNLPCPSQTINSQSPQYKISYPSIYKLLLNWLNFRWQRIHYLKNISYDLIPYWHFIYDLDIHYPLLFARFLILSISTILITGLLQTVSNRNHWEWEFYTP